MTDAIAERARKLDGDTLRSIGDIARHQRLLDSDQQQLTATAMLQELLADNRSLAGSLRTTHSLCEQHSDVATTSLIENWIDETEQRCWFLIQTVS
jgi:starvation-inducible DNA-binding protein